MRSPRAGPDTAALEIRRLSGFDDPLIDRTHWDRLLASGGTDVIFLTREWLRAWWETVGFGELHLLAAIEDGQCVAVAPLCAEGGMAFFLGSGHSDFIDFVGDARRPGVMPALLQAVQACVTGFVGMRLYAVPAASGTGDALASAGAALGWTVYRGKEWVAPYADLRQHRAAVESACDSASIRKRERWFQGRGTFEFQETADPVHIASQLPAYFAQNIERWADAPRPSPFTRRAERAFIERLAADLAPTAGFRFSSLRWQGRPIAFECGWAHRRTYHGGPSCFAADVARRSAGQVLQWRLMLAALRDGFEVYEYGTGEESYKFKFSTGVKSVWTWELYPAAVPSGARTA